MQEKNDLYLYKIKSVTNYIKTNLNKDLSTKQLSEKFGISYYHFHRIMSAALKEPLASYISRKKLDTAVQLIRYSDLNFESIAENIGYNDLSAFSKAFVKEFGISPQKFKNDSTLVLNTHVDYSYKSDQKFVSDLKPKTISIADKKVYYIEVIDKYGGKKTQDAWDMFIEFATTNKLWGWRPDVFSIYYDDPQEVGEYNCKTDICIATKKEVPTSIGINTKLIKGGKYTVFRYKGPWDQLEHLYDKIYNEWVLKENIVLSDKPVIEKYLSFSAHTNPNNLLTEICFPI